MPKNMVVILLTALILTLLVPLTMDFLSIERAFTQDNLIQINLTSK